VPSSTLLSLTTSNGAISATGITRENHGAIVQRKRSMSTGVKGKLDLRTTNGAIKIAA